MKENKQTGRVVLVTSPTGDTAEKLAEGMISQRLAACVNIVPLVKSIYRWKGEINRDDEALLVIKTSSGKVEELKKFISTNHPYEVAEFIVLTPEKVAENYLSWLLSETADS
ncbi:MAG: divalent-cation tolerance protein CutA [Myxococcota bacterium]